MLSSKLLQMFVQEIGEWEIMDKISRGELIDYVCSNCNPDDVFSVRELEAWALDNGFVRE